MRTYRIPTSLKSALGATLVGGLLAAGPGLMSGHHEHGAERTAEHPARTASQGTASALLRVAEQEKGIKENASGGGTPFHAWYMASPRAKETAARDGGSPRSYANAPWCAMFVSWVGEKAGMRSTVGSDAYTVAYAQWFKDNHHWGTTPKQGAVVFYDWNGGKSVDGIDHVGLVKKDNGDGTITTIEGNTGNGIVEQRVRPQTDVVGYGYPQYRA
jgi:hypothetical protein